MTSISAVVRLALGLSVSTVALAAGILVCRTDGGLQFLDAQNLAVNGKDKVLSLGGAPALSGPAGKLQQIPVARTLIKVHASKVVAAYESGHLTYLMPQSQSKTPAEPATLWESARISYKKSPSDKTSAEITGARLLAFLPGGVDELVRLSMDGTALELLGGKGQAFPTQLEVLGAVARTYRGNPAVAPLEKYVEKGLHDRYARFEGGLAPAEVLDQGLKLAALSQEIYPDSPAQAALRKAFADRKRWLDRKMAVLRAFAASGEWDAFLLADRDFEKYQGAFPEMRQRHLHALEQSFALHQANGKARMEEGEYGAGFREFRLASVRRPSDSALQRLLGVAWTEHSRQVAVDQRAKRKQLSVGQRESINQALHFAARYQQEKKLDEALKSVAEAESVDRYSLPVLLKKAEILGARREFGKALEALDEYDLRAVDDERPPASQLRNELLFQLTATLRDTKTQMEKAWAEGRFHRVRQLALQGLQAKDDDPDVLYYAGVSSLLLRHRDAATFLNRYLDVSNTLDAQPEKRARVRGWLSVSPPAAPESSEAGDPNWLSGRVLPPGVYYCPFSLAFHPRIERIEASEKLRVAFEWDGGRLKAITPSFEKNEHVTGEKQILFTYDTRLPQVATARMEGAAAPPPATDPDDLVQRASLVLPNNPYIDPLAAATITGKNLAVGFAGNRFFNPFVWEKLYFFRFTYDDQGRVRQALEIGDVKPPSPPVLLEFDWDGLQLAGVRGYQTPAGDRRVPVYERRMQYQEGRLVAEEIRHQGKVSRIRYTYVGNRLASARCEKDTSVDGRSRQVTFLARASSGPSR